MGNYTRVQRKWNFYKIRYLIFIHKILFFYENLDSQIILKKEEKQNILKLDLSFLKLDFHI